MKFVAANLALKLDLRLDRRMGCGAIGIEVGRSVVTLDDGHGAAGRDARNHPPHQHLREEMMLVRIGTMELTISGKPLRETVVENFLKGKTLNADLGEQAAAIALAHAAPLKYNSTKIDMAKGLLASGLAKLNATA